MTAFEKWYDDYSLCRDDEHITRWSMEKAFEAGAQSERDKHRWILVTERLPNKQDGEADTECGMDGNNHIYIQLIAKVTWNKYSIPCKYYLQDKCFERVGVIAWKSLLEE